MRRPLVTAVIAIAAAVTIAGCSAEQDTSASAPATSAPAGGADEHSGHIIGTPEPGSTPARVATGNAAKVCAEALKASSASAQTYVAELGKMLQATGAKDTAAAKEAERQAAAAITDWAAAMNKQSAEATDPQLKALLAEIATEVGTMKADIASIQESTLETLQQRLDELCGG